MADDKPKWGGHNKTPELSDRETQLLEHMAAIGSLNKDMAEALGISERTFYAILKEQPELARRLKQSKQNMLNKVKASAYRQALQGDKTMMIFILKTQAGWRDVNEYDGESNVVFKTEILPSGEFVRTKQIVESNPVDIVDVESNDKTEDFSD